MPQRRPPRPRSSTSFTFIMRIYAEWFSPSGGILFLGGAFGRAFWARCAHWQTRSWCWSGTQKLAFVCCLSATQKKACPSKRGGFLSSCVSKSRRSLLTGRLSPEFSATTPKIVSSEGEITLGLSASHFSTAPLLNILQVEMKLCTVRTNSERNLSLPFA